MTVSQKNLISELESIIESNLSNEQFGVEELAKSYGISRSQLHRKLKEATGKSLSALIREYRLKKALEILKYEDVTSSETAYRVGFGSATYFSKSFSDFYGFSPSDVLRKKISLEEKTTLPNTKSSFRIRNWVYFIGFLGIILASLILYFSVQRNTTSPNTTSGENSIAVLPFENLSENPENLYFSEGVADAITRQLSQINDLKIISRTTTSHFINNEKSTKQLAEELNINYVLDGSIQRINKTIRIEVRLIDPVSQNQIWADHYDREIKDIFRIQNEIAQNVATALKAKLSPAEINKLGSGYTDNAEAYDLYLKGVFEYRTYTRKGNQLAIDFLSEAIELDPDFALAHAYLAHSTMAQGSMVGSKINALEAFSISVGSNDKALELVPNLPEALLYKGFYTLYNDWNFNEAGDIYQKAISNNNPDAFALYADYLHFINRHDEAAKIARELEITEPFYPNTRMILAHYYKGEYEEAINFAESRLKILNNYYTLDNYGFVLLNTGEYQKAIAIFNEIFEIENFRYPRILGWLGAAYARNGDEKKALSILNELEEIKKITSGGSPGFFIAVVNMALGERDEALNWLEIAVKDHEMEIPWLTTEPQLFALHDDKRFQDLVQIVGFPE